MTFKEDRRSARTKKNLKNALLTLLQEKDLKEMLIFANAAASIITTRKGALMVMPSIEDIRNLKEEAKKHADSKRQQVGTGDRSERIRTYNFPQSRVTDHRYGVSVYDLPELMEGDLDLLLDIVLEEVGRMSFESILKGE